MKSQISGLLQQAILVAACLMIANRRLYAQGSVNFCNNGSTLVSNSATVLPVSAADEISAALYWSPVGVSNFVQIGSIVAVGTPLSGLFAAGKRLTGTATPGGATGQFQVRAWGGGYASYELALQAGPGVLLGQSAILQIVTGNSTALPPTPPVSLLSGGLQSFTLTPSVTPLDVDIGLRAFDGNSTIKVAFQNGTTTSAMRICKNGTNYGMVMVNTTDPNASRIRVQTSSGIKAWKRLP